MPTGEAIATFLCRVHHIKSTTPGALPNFIIESFVNIVLALERMLLQELLQLLRLALIFTPTASSRTLTLAQLHFKTQHTPQPFSNMQNNFSPLPLAPLVGRQYTNIPCLR
jgi:hypothetical protein